MDATQTIDTVVAVAAHVEAELDEALGECGLSRPSFHVLRALEAAPGGTLPQRALSASVRRTAGTLSVRLGRLERAGMVRRSADPDDRRAARVEITDAGRALLAEARPRYDERATRLAAALTPRARDELDEHMRAWLEFFEPAADAPRLGIAIAPSATANRMRRAVGLPERGGVLVLSVRPGSPAARGGLARGDLVVSAAGEEVRTMADLDRAVRRATGPLALALLRGAEPLELEVALD